MTRRRVAARAWPARRERRPDARIGREGVWKRHRVGASPLRMRRGRPPYANDPAARQRSDAFFEEMPAPRAEHERGVSPGFRARGTRAVPQPVALGSARAQARGGLRHHRALAPGVSARHAACHPEIQPRNPASAAWTASDRYLARACASASGTSGATTRATASSCPTKTVRICTSCRTIPSTTTSGRCSRATPRRVDLAARGPRVAPCPRDRGRSERPPGGDGRVDRRARSGETFEDGASRDGGGAPAPTPSPRARGGASRSSRKPPRRSRLSPSRAAPPSCPSQSRRRVRRLCARACPGNPSSRFRRRRRDLAADDALRVSEDGASSSDGSGVDVAVDVAVDAATPSPEPTRLYARRVFEDGDSERFSSREGGKDAHLWTDAAASAADSPAARGRTNPRPDEEPETHRTLIDSIARKDSGDLLASVRLGTRGIDGVDGEFLDDDDNERRRRETRRAFAEELAVLPPGNVSRFRRVERDAVRLVRVRSGRSGFIRTSFDDQRRSRL